MSLRQSGLMDSFLDIRKILTPKQLKKLNFFAIYVLTVRLLLIFFAQIEIIFEKYNIKEGSHIMNLDESGYTPGRESSGSNNKTLASFKNVRVYDPQSGFKYKERITILGCVSADGHIHTPCIVVKGTGAVRPTVDGKSVNIEEFMGDNWIVMYRKQLASVDTEIFLEWAKIFLCTNSKKGQYGKIYYIIL